MRSFLILVSAFFTGWAGVAWWFDFNADATLGLMLAVLGLAGVFYLDYRLQEARDRALLERERVWMRREGLL